MMFLFLNLLIFTMAEVVAKKIVLLFVFLFPLNFNAETISCIIKLGGFKIGTLSAIHIKAKNIDYYTIVSNVEVSLLIKVKVYYKTETVYKDDMLIKSTVNSIVNGKKYNSFTKWNGERYSINCETHKYKFEDSTRTKPINWSVSKLYFNKPQNSTEVFAETYGQTSYLKLNNNGFFLFEIPNSKQLYAYSIENKFDAVEMINPIKNFKVIKLAITD